MTSPDSSTALRAVRFATLAEPDGTPELVRLALAEPTKTVDEALALAVRLGEQGVYPGEGRTAELWQALASLAASDLGVARTIEPHLDALAILHQAPGDEALPTGTWGVFASEGGGAPVLERDKRLEGTKAWCSLADRLHFALVSARVDGTDSRQLFAVDLTAPGVTVLPGRWHARGLTEIPSGPVQFDGAVARPVGARGWYLERPGFAWGGMGVAACWYGGAVGLARSLFAAATVAPGPFISAHLGVVDALLEDSRRALAEAAALVDGGHATGDDGRLLAKRVRSTVARASEEVLRHTAHALGPGPLASDPAHAKRVADLELYLRQHHAEKDDASLGSQLLGTAEPPW